MRGICGGRVAIGALALSVVIASPAAAKLPRTYQVSRIDSPAPQSSGNFGMTLANVGDVEGDGFDDLLTGTDKHGRRVGQVFVISARTGAQIREYALPDADPGGAGERAAGFGAAVAALPDITGDGIAEHVVSASGVDIDQPADDLGVVYVFDGGTGALIKRLRMPPADRAQQIAAGGQDPWFGRTVLVPSTPFQGGAAALGDLDGAGKGDVLVGATDFTEDKASANPQSECATQAGTTPCVGSGRVYLYRGEDMTGDPATPLESPTVIKNPASQPDSPTPINPFANGEAFAILLVPVGDTSSCPAAPAAGAKCPAPSRTLDGSPEFAIAANAVDVFGIPDVGIVQLFDGRTQSVMATYETPDIQTSASFGIAQNGVVGPMGDVGAGTQPDFWVPNITFSDVHRGQGRGYTFNGDPVVSGFRSTLTYINDPTPQESEQFGLSAVGIPDTDFDGRNEILAGGMGPHNPGNNPAPVNDVHIFNPLTGEELQRVPAPDRQGGESFGVALAPLDDLNGDGLLDFAVGAGQYDLASAACPGGGCPNAGRIYVFRSDDSPAPPASPPAGGPQGPPGPAGSAAAALAGRSLEIEASRSRVPRGTRVRLEGLLEAFADDAACEAGQEVELQRRRRGTLRYRTFRRVTTDDDGTFAARIRVRTTRFYRALARRTDACLGAASPREKVTAVRR